MIAYCRACSFGFCEHHLSEHPASCWGTPTVEKAQKYGCASCAVCRGRWLPQDGTPLPIPTGDPHDVEEAVDAAVSALADDLTDRGYTLIGVVVMEPTGGPGVIVPKGTEKKVAQQILEGLAAVGMIAPRGRA